MNVIISSDDGPNVHLELPVIPPPGSVVTARTTYYGVRTFVIAYQAPEITWNEDDNDVTVYLSGSERARR